MNIYDEIKLNKEIIHQNKNGIEYIEFKRLNEYGIKNAYTLKGEKIDFSNDSEYEKSSYEKLCKSLNLNEENLVKPKQTHSSNVKVINKVTSIEKIDNTDGLITNNKNIILTTKNADCILFLFYDPVQKVIANVHSGWRGTFQKIAEKTVVKMINYYRCNPKDIIVCISPCLRKCHFEVDEDVKNLCAEIFKFTNELENIIFKGEIKEGKQKYFIDTVLINKILFKELGILEKNIIDSNLCSMCYSEKISSNRVEGKNFTRATALISL